MGKHLQARDLDDESRDKQPGCIWGLVNALDYHHWQSNVKKMIHHRKYEGRTHDKLLTGNWSPGVNGDYEKLLDEREGPLHGAKASRAPRRRSLKARINAVIAEETSREGDGTPGKGAFSAKSRLQRTYSIHHLESVDDFFGKIRTDWDHPIIFFPRNAENLGSKASDAAQTKASRGESDMHSPKDAAELSSKEEKPDVFDIFKVDKELLLKQLQDSNEGIANFSRSAFGLNRKGKFSKSRSFPVADLAQRRKLKPLKLESKQSEVWSFPRDEKAHSSKGEEKDSQPCESLIHEEEENAVCRIGEQDEGDGIRKRTHRRSSSLTESLDKYARLFETSFAKEDKLGSSQSLKLASREGYAPLYPQRRRSHSYADSCYLDVNFEVLDDTPLGSSLVVIAEDFSSDPQNSEDEEVFTLVTKSMEVNEDDTSLSLHPSNEKCKTEEILEDKSDSPSKKDADYSDITLDEVQDQGFFLDTEHPQVELHLHEGKGNESRILKLNSVTDSDLQSLHGEHLLSSQDLEGYEIKEETMYPGEKITDLDYVRHILDRSGIATDGSEMAWHASDQLFSPELFEEAEACWPHEADQIDGWPDFQGCWHHKMLFDLVNFALVEVYDISLPYYPKPLSSSCHVRPFPIGDRITEEVCSRIGTLMDIKPEEKQVLDSIVAHDRSWMNLQLESESIALYLEDMIFAELLQEVMFS